MNYGETYILLVGCVDDAKATVLAANHNRLLLRLKNELLILPYVGHGNDQPRDQRACFRGDESSFCWKFCRAERDHHQRYRTCKLR